MMQKRVLENGIRIVAEQMKFVQSVSIGLWVNIGSRDEEAYEHGISHFLEHMFFKGTSRRSARKIAQEIDAIGGELNAFTSRETTTFYAKVLEEHLPKAVKILADNFHHSQFAPREIEKEKQVVMEEIKMVEDDPEGLVHTLHMEGTLDGNALGRSILGTTETLSQINRKKILHFLRRTYDARHIVIAVAGRFHFDTLFALLQNAFGKYRQPDTSLLPRIPPQITPRSVVKKKKLAQVHLCISMPGLPVSHPQRETLQILNAILGGGVSSRLFQEVRERRGLAYSIYSCLSLYQDGGLLTIYAATRPESAQKVLELIFKEIRQFKEKGAMKEEMKKAKEHLKGNLLLSMESSCKRMSWLAKNELYFGRFFPLEEVIRKGILRVTGQHVHELAHTLFQPQSLSLTALGPVESHQLSAPLDL